MKYKWKPLGTHYEIPNGMKHHSAPTRMAKMKKTDHTDYWWQCGATGNSYTADGNVNRQSFRKMVVSSKIQHTPTIRPIHSTPRYLLKRNESIYQHKPLTRMFIDAFKQWMDKVQWSDLHIDMEKSQNKYV